MSEAEAFKRRMHEVEHTVALGDAAVLAERRRCAALARTMSTVIDDVGEARRQIAEAIEEGRQP